MVFVMLDLVELVGLWLTFASAGSIENENFDTSAYDTGTTSSGTFGYCRPLEASQGADKKSGIFLPAHFRPSQTTIFHFFFACLFRISNVFSLFQDDAQLP